MFFPGTTASERHRTIITTLPLAVSANIHPHPLHFPSSSLPPLHHQRPDISCFEKNTYCDNRKSFSVLGSHEAPSWADGYHLQGSLASLLLSVDDRHNVSVPLASKVLWELLVSAWWRLGCLGWVEQLSKGELVLGQR